MPTEKVKSGGKSKKGRQHTMHKVRRERRRAAGISAKNKARRIAKQMKKEAKKQIKLQRRREGGKP